MPKLQQKAPVTYGDALDRVGIKPNLPEYPDGVYQTVCHKCDYRTLCAASKFLELGMRAVSPRIRKNGFCLTYTHDGYNPSRYYTGSDEALPS